jgi:nicotinamidase-related amidase
VPDPVTSERSVLLLIDLQQEYLWPGGPMKLPEAPAALERAAALLAAARAADIPIVHVRHVSEHPAAEEFRPGTPQVEIRPEVAPTEGESVVDKRAPSVFAGTTLEPAMRGAGIDTILMAGFMTGTCCLATAHEAVGRGYRTLAASDAMAAQAYGPRSASETHEAALDAHRAVGVEVMTTAELAALLP